MKNDLQSSDEDAVKSYIANFHFTDAYASFAFCWCQFVYVEVLDRVDELYLEFNTSNLRIEFLEEEPQTTASDVEIGEANDGDVEAPKMERLKNMSMKHPIMKRLQLSFRTCLFSF